MCLCSCLCLRLCLRLRSVSMLVSVPASVPTSGLVFVSAFLYMSVSESASLPTS